MISSKNRFKGRRDPRIVLKHGQTSRDNKLQVKYLIKQGQDGWRAAVIVSTKVAKSAPKRNRIRRRVYELLRQEEIKNGADLIVLVYDEEIAKVDHSELKNSLHRLLQKANLV